MNCCTEWEATRRVRQHKEWSNRIEKYNNWNEKYTGKKSIAEYKRQKNRLARENQSGENHCHRTE